MNVEGLVVLVTALAGAIGILIGRFSVALVARDKSRRDSAAQEHQHKLEVAQEVIQQWKTMVEQLQVRQERISAEYRQAAELSQERYDEQVRRASRCEADLAAARERARRDGELIRRQDRQIKDLRERLSAYLPRPLSDPEAPVDEGGPPDG